MKNRVLFFISHRSYCDRASELLCSCPHVVVLLSCCCCCCCAVVSQQLTVHCCCAVVVVTDNYCVFVFHSLSREKPPSKRGLCLLQQAHIVVCVYPYLFCFEVDHTFIEVYITYADCFDVTKRFYPIVSSDIVLYIRYSPLR
jgi:hypothetical protein